MSMKKKYFTIIICFFCASIFSQHKKSVYLDYNSYKNNFKIKVPTDESSYIERFEISEKGTTFVFIYDPLVYKKKKINYDQLKNICFISLDKLRELNNNTARVFIVERINNKFYEIKPIRGWSIHFHKS